MAASPLSAVSETGNHQELPMGTDYIRLKRESLETFCQRVFQSLNLSEDDARMAAAVLVAADARGIPSHGVARLQRYVNGLQTGLMLPDAPVEVLVDTPSSIVLHAHGAMGAPVSVKAMESVINKAKTNGAAFGCVRDSNHFGIAGYYAMMALDEDMLGIAMTNTAALGVPTFGRRVMYGTNPLAFAAPADEERAFVLDTSTTVVTRGKIEVYERLGKELPMGWAVNKTGQPASDAQAILDDMFHRVGGGILPLGGAGEEFGGHKGYGLSIMVDILCAVLCGAPFGPDLSDTEGLRNCPRAEGAERVYFAGQKEFEKEEECLRIGVPLLKKIYDQICMIGNDHGVVSPPILPVPSTPQQWCNSGERRLERK
jgi:LDH2 family malate/lactate/ureidoglycolate dehydrogenase